MLGTMSTSKSLLLLNRPVIYPVQDNVYIAGPPFTLRLAGSNFCPKLEHFLGSFVGCNPGHALLHELFQHHPGICSGMIQVLVTHLHGLGKAAVIRLSPAEHQFTPIQFQRAPLTHVLYSLPLRLFPIHRGSPLLVLS